LVAYCSDRLAIDYSTCVATRTTLQSATSWDEEETLENIIPVPIFQSGYSTAIATGTSAGLKSRFHNIVADVDITSILMPRTTEVKPKGIGGLQHLRKRTQAGRKGFRGRAALQMKASQSAPPNFPPESDRRIEWAPIPDTIATLDSPSLFSEPSTKKLVLLDDSDRKLSESMSKFSKFRARVEARTRGPGDHVSLMRLQSIRKRQ